MFEQFKLVIGILCALALVWIVLDLLYWYATRDTESLGIKFQRWLVGYQKNYHLMADGSVGTTVGRQNLENRKKGWLQPTVELRRGFWRGRSKIYAGNWELSKVAYGWMGYDDKIGVSLCDKLGLSIPAALRMAGRYPSLLELLEDLERTKTDLRRSQGLCEEFRKNKTELEDRITELEEELHRTQLERSEWAAALDAIRRTILEGKQKFRSPAAQEIRMNIERAFADMPRVRYDQKTLDKWLKLFSKNERFA